jgi:transcriptional regulator with XRE-family HTH domain
VDIGNRLREIRHAKGMSQADIEKRTGIFRCYISRVELGFIVPKLPTLEKLVKALGTSLCAFFVEGEVRRKPAKVVRLNTYEKRLFVPLRRTEKRDRRLFLSIANKMARQRVRKTPNEHLAVRVEAPALSNSVSRW